MQMFTSKSINLRHIFSQKEKKIIKYEKLPRESESFLNSFKLRAERSNSEAFNFPLIFSLSVQHVIFFEFPLLWKTRGRSRNFYKYETDLDSLSIGDILNSQPKSFIDDKFAKN